MAAVEGPGALPTGIAVDLGCGSSVQARYLAARGWAVTAVDSAPAAPAVARGGGEQQRPRPVEWRVAEVTEHRQVDPHGRLAGTVTLLLDNGCLHGVPAARRPR
ncbi:class I SAM-dependent methyltransferase [Streptomyces actuosus]|uniref:Class I SAM-dependent methyltransferase n=1 Tax=Streptomyces actuosus TaxID=1885 RepID=A0ABS2VJF9_STRAS|nr:class I SAM-dependent methyltransferase [Streptomyces actuosus]MBN0043242.1 class I SAM-dependent methyltransferase [Streptomyces actuosus]